MPEYLLKIKGKAALPDYLQVRDSDFTLVLYCRIDKYLEQKVRKFNTEIAKIIAQNVNDIPFGKIVSVKNLLKTHAS